MAGRFLIAVVLLLAGLAVGAWMAGSARDSANSPASDADGNLSLGERVAALEKRLADEQAARALVEDRLQEILEQLGGDAGLEGDESASAGAQQENPSTDAATRGAVRRNDMTARMARMREQRLNRLLENGYAESEAQEILRLESVASLEAMRAAFEAQRDGDMASMMSNRINPQTILRERIGDAEYERFLTAQGQRTTVQIANVLEGSPGSAAGLRPGDEIVSYNGERTFSITDIRGLAMRGEPGTDAVIEIERDGVRMQLTVPAGPIGVSGQGAQNVGMSWWGG